jgi:hypothetical protein
MRIRNVLQEHEAQLTPVEKEYAKARGKSEWKRYGDESRRLKVSVSGVNLPDGTTLEISIDGRQIGEMIVQRKIARFERETEKGENVAPVGVDQVLQVSLKGKVIMEGKYYAE